MFILNFIRHHPIWSAIIVLIIVYNIPTKPQPVMPRQSTPAQAPSSTSETVKKRGSSPIGRAYMAAGITKTLRQMGYPATWTILGDTSGGSPVLILECAKFSDKSIQSFIERGILSDLYADSFDRVDFSAGSRTWSYELNKTHVRPRPKGKSYLFYSNLTQAEFDQVDKQFLKDRGL